MKRKISLLIAVSMVLAMLAGIQVSAATYTRGTVLDFDVNTVTSFEDGTSLADDAEYGKVFNWNTRAKNLILDFSSGNTVADLTTGAHILSFDAKVAENNILFMYFDDYNPESQEWKRISYTALRNKNFQASADGGSKWTSVVSAAYENDEWAHYDMVFYFEDCYADIYVDGVFGGELSLELNESNTVNGFNKILFVGSNSPTDAPMDLSMDNICYRSYTKTADIEIKPGDEQFEVAFTETMDSAKEEDFTVSRTSLEDGTAQNLSFAYESKGFTKGVLIPEKYEPGYTYTVAYKGGKTAIGSNIAAKSVDITLKQSIIDDLRDFEDLTTGTYGTASADKVSVIKEEYRGNVFKVNGNIDWYYRLDQKLDGGRYIYSFDVKNAGVWGKMRLRFYSNDSWKWFNTFAIEGNGMGSNFKDKLSVMADSVIPTNEWHRVDLLLDMDNDSVTAYLDGVEKGSFVLTTEGDGTPYDGIFRGSMMSFNNTNGDAYFDNIRTRNISDKYDVSMMVDENLVYIDFAETTVNLKEDNFVVTKAENALSANVQNVDFTLVYQNGSRAVLKLSENVTTGIRYIVKLNNVKSFIGNTPEKNELSYLYTPDIVTIHNDDMSTYTTENMWTDSRWTTAVEGNSANAVENTTASNGAVTLSGADKNKLLKYNIASVGTDEGVIEIETTLNATHTSAENGSTALVYYRFVDQAGTEFNLGEIHANGFMAAASKNVDSKDTYTNKNTAFVFGQDTTIKTVIDMSTKKISTTCGDKTLVSEYYPLNVSGTNYADSIKSIPIISFTALGGYGVTLNVKNIKVTKTVTPSVIGNVTFMDVMGNECSVTDVSSATNKMKIEFSNGLFEDKFNGVVEVNDGKSIVPVVADKCVYDKATGIYTMTFDRLLGAEKNYTVKISGVKDAKGITYKELSGSFTTGEAITEISNEDAVKTASGIDVMVKGVNTGFDATYYVIYTGFKGNKLVAMDYDVWELTEEFTDYTKTFSFEDSKIAECDKINSFIWRSFTEIKPVTNSITK